MVIRGHGWLRPLVALVVLTFGRGAIRRTCVVSGEQRDRWAADPCTAAERMISTLSEESRETAYNTMPDWAVEGLTVRDWGVPRFWTQSGLHNSNLVLARFDYAFDSHAASEVTKWMDRDLIATIDGNEAMIEAAGVRLHSYTAPGDDHGLFEFGKFYEIEVNGVRLVDWLTTLLTHEPPDDVHCEQCGQ